MVVVIFRERIKIVVKEGQFQFYLNFQNFLNNIVFKFYLGIKKLIITIRRNNFFWNLKVVRVVILQMGKLRYRKRVIYLRLGSRWVKRQEWDRFLIFRVEFFFLQMLYLVFVSIQILFKYFLFVMFFIFSRSFGLKGRDGFWLFILIGGKVRSN